MRKSFSNPTRQHSAKAAASTGPRAPPSRTKAQTLSGYKSSDLQVIASSDSDDVECVSPFQSHSQTKQRKQTPVASQVTAKTPTRPVHNASQSSTRKSKPAASPVVLDTDEDDFIEIRSTHMKRTAQAAVSITPKKRTCVRPAKAHSIQSSPSLLRGSSPTIRRFNSNDSLTVVLAIDSQDTDDEAKLASPIMSNSLSGDTVFGSAPHGSVLSAIPASSPPISPVDYIPETPRRMLTPTPPAVVNPRVLKPVRTDLLSDPISEFCTPLDKHPSIQKDTQTEEYTQTSVTQWYHDNLVTESAAGESQNADVTRVADSNSSIGLHLDMSDAASDDGYSSPLEGFYDLRTAGQNNVHDLYVNQFGIPAQQSSTRSENIARPVRPATPMPERPAGLVRSIRPAGSAHPVRSAGSAHSIRPAGLAHSIRPVGPSRSAVHGTMPKPIPKSMPRMFTSGPQRPNQPHGGGIRPVVSSRPPFQRATVRQPAAPVGYNHYADDPCMELGDFMGWEKPGISKFG
ncbi:hypothetical protein IW145_002993 [Coemansia sp. RSA 521]|nr:hypothetical protein IW145_002993 [Coemansia sp. RSA 521]